jgi:uncharacterized protein (TIGR02231 family)
VRDDLVKLEGQGEMSQQGAAPERRGALSSRAARVTFFEDRAEVVRSASARAEAGVSAVAIAGVSPYVDPRSVQARVAGDAARVLSARVLWRAHNKAALGREAIDALEAESLHARKQASAAGKALERAERAEARATSLITKWAMAVAAVPRGARKPEVLSTWRSSLALLDREVREAWSSAAAARKERARAEDDLERAEARLEEGSIEMPRYEAVIEVQLEAAEAREVEIEVTYRVPSALWRPEHLARLIPAEGGAPASVEIVTWATAWQRTGEAWDGITARFSTARPARSASPPALEDDVLAARRKTDQERSRVRVEARDQAVVLAGLDRGTRAIEEMPGVDDGGEPVSFEASNPVSIASNGRPFRVEIARRRVDATLERVLFPEIAPSAHVRATATLTKGGPLLAGPLRLVRGQSLIGRSKIGYVGAGEPFEIGFGPDEGVRVRRTQDEERDTTQVLGTQKLRRTVRVFLSNLSDEARRVLVTERVPVSEIDEVEISVLEASGWKLDDKDGFAKSEVSLPANATQTLKLVYEIRASSKVVMPF